MPNFYKTIKKQLNLKYDDRNRIKKEKKMSRISYRVSEETKRNIEKLAKEANVTQTDAIEMLINHGVVYEMPAEGKKLSIEVSNLNQRLNEAIELFHNGYNAGAIKKINQIGRDFTEVKRASLTALIGR